MFLHTFIPHAVFLTVGPLTIYWYGVTMALALAVALGISLMVARWHSVAPEVLYDTFFYLVIGGFIGARLFYVLYNPAPYLAHPLDVFKIWEGGIAIHGGMIAGGIVLWRMALRHRINAWQLASIIAPGVALGQAIGRWGNYFNQEVFGLPTGVPWGVPIALLHRPVGFEQFTYFHPTFLYESIGNVVIFGVLLWLHRRLIHSSTTPNVQRPKVIVLTYLLFYSGLRLGMEFLRIDPVVTIVGVRITMMVTIIILVGTFIALGKMAYRPVS